jgi:transposase
LAVLPAAPLHLPRRPAKGREIAIKVLDSFHTCPIPEVARLGRTLRAWKAQVLAYFDTSGVSNGGTEAICECGGGWSGTG